MANAWLKVLPALERHNMQLIWFPLFCTLQFLTVVIFYSFFLIFWFPCVEIAKYQLPLGTSKKQLPLPAFSAASFLWLFLYRENPLIGKLILYFIFSSIPLYLEGVRHQIKAWLGGRHLNTSISISRIPVKVIISILFPVADPSTEAAINWEKNKLAMETQR